MLTALLLTLGLGARAAQPLEPPDFKYLYADIYERFFDVRPGTEADPVLESRRERSIPQSFRLKKAPGTKRIFIVGGSVAAKLYDGPGAFQKTAGGPEKVEVLNCGMGAYDSYRDALVADEVLDYQPDLLVLLSGNNEARSPVRVNLGLYEAGKFLSRFALYRNLHEKLGKSAASVDKPDLKSRLAQLEENLRGLVRKAKAKGVPVVLCTLPNNLQLPPRPGLRRPDWEDDDFAAGWSAMERGRGSEAVKAFQAYAAKRPGDAQADFWLGRALARSGRTEQARASWLRALDEQEERCGPAKNEVIRRVCGREGCKVADLEKAFYGAPAAQGAFSDGVHWYKEYNGEVSALILKAAGLGPGPSGRWPAPALSPEREDHPAYYAVRLLLEDGVSRREDAAALFESAAKLDPRLMTELPRSKERVRKVLAGNAWSAASAAKLEEAWPRVLEHAGEAWRRRGDNARAKAFLDEALKLDPGLPWARLYRAQAASALGLKAAAQDDLKELQARSGSYPAAAKLAKQVEVGK